LRDEIVEDRNVPPGSDVREAAVRLILTREVSRAQLAGDLGISLSILSRWVRDVIDQSPFGDVLESLHDEVGTLRKENAALQKMLFARAAKGSVERNWS
jgi:transposase-like protein